MKKQLITIDQLAALSFLRFGKLDGIDMTIIKNGINDVVEIELQDDSHDYFILSDGTIILEDSYIQKFNKGVDKELFESLIGTNIQKRLDNMDMLEFMLKKIKLLTPCCVDDDEIFKNFSMFQIRIIGMLYKDGCIINRLKNDSVDSGYQVIELTKRGELYLFLMDHKDDVNRFKMLLEENGYNSMLVNAFLITQDLSMDTKEMLTLNNFIEFVNQYGVESYSGDDSKAEYRRVRVSGNK